MPRRHARILAAPSRGGKCGGTAALIDACATDRSRRITSLVLAGASGSGSQAGSVPSANSLLKKCGTGYQPVKNTGKIAGATLPNGVFRQAANR
jgi:hypothetical protein